MEFRVGSERLVSYAGEEIPHALEVCPMLLTEVRRVFPSRRITRIQVFENEVIFDTESGGTISYSWKRDGSNTVVSFYNYDETVFDNAGVVFASDTDGDEVFERVMEEFSRLRWLNLLYIEVLNDCREVLLFPSEEFVTKRDIFPRNGLLSQFVGTILEVLKQEGFRDDSYITFVWNNTLCLITAVISIDLNSGEYLMIRGFDDCSGFDFLIYHGSEGAVEYKYGNCFQDLSEEFACITDIYNRARKSP